MVVGDVEIDIFYWLLKGGREEAAPYLK